MLIRSFSVNLTPFLGYKWYCDGNGCLTQVIESSERNMPMTITLSKEDRVKKMVRSIMQDYTNATSIACIFVDIQGKERSSKYNFTKFCHFMRSIPEFRSKCYQCDLCGGLKRSRTAPAARTAAMPAWWISRFLSSARTSFMASSYRGR